MEIGGARAAAPPRARIVIPVDGAGRTGDVVRTTL
jgi:hypothetical protein